MIVKTKMMVMIKTMTMLDIILIVVFPKMIPMRNRMTRIFLRMTMIKNDGCLVGRPAQGLYLVNYFTAAQRQRSPIAILKQFGKHFG